MPLVIGQFLEMIDANYGVVSSTSGSTYHARILSTLDREKLKPNASVGLHRHAHSVVEILPAEADSSVQMLQMTQKPDVTYSVRVLAVLVFVVSFAHSLGSHLLSP